MGFTLREECGDALPEVGARVAHLDEIAILARREAALGRETANHFLGRQDRQRRIRRNLQGKFAHGALDLVGGHNAVHQAEAVRLGCARKPAREQQFLGPSRAGKVHQPAIRRAGQAVAERSRDGNPEGRLGRRHAQVACQRNGASTAGRHTVHVRNGRFPHALNPVQHLVDPFLVAEPIVRSAEALELRDVGPGDERLAAGSP